ncbi:MAG: peptide chain release factor 2 [Chitinispirillaceae bacterium]|nr:peptide chain release factor 2 [Chitinispirillaceae bacterium]
MFGGIFEVDPKEELVLKLEKEAAGAAFWSDTVQAKKTLRSIKDARRIIDPWKKAKKEGEELLGLFQMALDDNDEGMIAECEKQASLLQAEVQRIEFARKMSGEDDPADAVLAIHSGAGGTESCDWTDMLFRMYSRWIEKNKFGGEVIDLQPGESAGLKSVAIEVRGEYAYGYLKAETGVHRLVRISPFDANKKRHTSFASVYAYPIIEEIDEFSLDENDIRVDTYRASGAGGQHVNKTDSAVRMTHLPTGIVVACQNERSQMKNRSQALRMLKARVRQHYKEIEEKERAAKMAEKKKIEWGSQIRSYVLHPYNMVKDHRTGVETSNTAAVLDGDIDSFIEAWLLER